MNTRQETIPIPQLPEYAFGEKLGAGTYGKTISFVRIFSFDFHLNRFRNCI